MTEEPVFWTQTSVSGSADDRLRWLRDSLGTFRRLRAGGMPLVGYAWWPLFGLVDLACREGERPVEDHLRHVGLYDLGPSGKGGFFRVETPAAEALRAAVEEERG